MEGGGDAEDGHDDGLVLLVDVDLHLADVGLLGHQRRVFVGDVGLPGSEGKELGQKEAILVKKWGKRGSLLDLLLALLLGQAAAGFFVELGGQLLLVGPALLLRRQLVLEDTKKKNKKGVEDPISPVFTPKKSQPARLTRVRSVSSAARELRPKRSSASSFSSSSSSSSSFWGKNRHFQPKLLKKETVLPKRGSKKPILPKPR